MNEDHDDELRAAYAPRLETPAPADRTQCPPPDALLAALRGEGREADRLAVLDHALGCPACRPDLALLHSVSTQPASRSQTSAWRSGWRGLLPLVAAAVALFAVGTGGVRWWQTRQQDRIARGTGSGLPTLIAPTADGVTSGPIGFLWHAAPGALTYTIEVAASDGALLFTTATPDTAIRAPAGAIAPGQHRWWVRVKLDDGSERRSDAQVLRVR